MECSDLSLIHISWLKNNGGEISSSFAKFLSDEENRTIAEIMHFEEGDLLLIVADANKIVFDSLGALRCEAARRLGLIRQGEFKLLWVTEFPLLEYSEDDGRYYAKHHPFTMPMEEDLDALEKGENLDKIRSIAYDIVINGTEAGGGSVRISRPDIQKKVFKALGMTEEEAQSKFGFLLEAVSYTHLDVYKRQLQNSTIPTVSKRNLFIKKSIVAGLFNISAYGKYSPYMIV